MNSLKKISLGAIGAVVAIVVTSCPTRREEANELAANKRKWVSSQITSYRYKLEIGGMSGPETASIQVDNGVRTSLNPDRAVQDSVIKDWSSYDTMEKVFQLAEKSIYSGANRVSIRYDPSLGYPTSIVVDRWEDVIDDGIGYTITEFKPLYKPKHQVTTPTEPIIAPDRLQSVRSSLRFRQPLNSVVMKRAKA